MARKGKKTKEPQVEGIIEIGKTGFIIHLKDGKENQKIVLQKTQTNSSNVPLRSSIRKIPENKENVEEMPIKIRNESKNIRNIENVECGPTENCSILLTPINNRIMETGQQASGNVNLKGEMKIQKLKLNSNVRINIQKLDSCKQKKGEGRQNTDHVASGENVGKTNARCTRNRASKMVQMVSVNSENLMQKKNILKPKNVKDVPSTTQAKTPVGKSTPRQILRGKAPKTTKQLNKSTGKTGGSSPPTIKAVPSVSRQIRQKENIRCTRNQTLKQNQVGGKNEDQGLQRKSALKRKVVEDTAGPARKKSYSSTSEDEGSLNDSSITPLSPDFKPLKVIEAGKHKDLWIYVMTFVNSHGKRKKKYLKDVEAENKYPQLIINFFKERVKWNSNIIVT